MYEYDIHNDEHDDEIAITGKLTAKPLICRIFFQHTNNKMGYYETIRLFWNTGCCE